MKYMARARELLETPAILVALVAAVTLVGLNGTFTLRSAVAGSLISMLMVTALSIFSGTSGVFSFGHVAFMAIGAYATGLLASSEATKAVQLSNLPGWLASAQLTPILALLMAALVTGVFGLAVGIVVLRLSGLSAGLATLALLMISRVLLQKWDTYTHGTRGLIIDGGAPSLVELAVWAVVGVALAWLFRRSRVGMQLAASREDETAARAAGVSVYRERVLAFAASAFVAGIAGGLFALYFQSINPDSFFLTTTLTVIAMLVVGGSASVSGAVVGTILLATVLEVLRQIEDSVERPGISEAGMSLALLLVLFLRPSGLTGGNELRVRGFVARWRGKRPGGPTAEVETASIQADQPEATT